MENNNINCNELCTKCLESCNKFVDASMEGSFHKFRESNLTEFNQFINSFWKEPIQSDQDLLIYPSLNDIIKIIFEEIENFQLPDFFRLNYSNSLLYIVKDKPLFNVYNERLKQLHRHKLDESDSIFFMDSTNFHLTHSVYDFFTLDKLFPIVYLLDEKKYNSEESHDVICVNLGMFINQNKSIFDKIDKADIEDYSSLMRKIDRNQIESINFDLVSLFDWSSEHVLVNEMFFDQSYKYYDLDDKFNIYKNLVLFYSTLPHEINNKKIVEYIYFPAIGLDVNRAQKARSVRREVIGGLLVGFYEHTSIQQRIALRNFVQNVISSILELEQTLFLVTEYEDVKKHAIRAALSQVMARNLSHNIGSHVLNNLVDPSKYNTMILGSYHGIELNNKDLEFSTQISFLMNYLKYRMDYMSEVTFGLPTMQTTKRIYRDVFSEFDKVRLLLNSISGIQDFKFKIDFIDNNKSVHTNDMSVSFPSDILGVQAFYNLLENVIRNTAKHSQNRVPSDITRFTATFNNISPKDISIELIINSKIFYSVEISDNIVNNRLIDKDIIIESDREDFLKYLNLNFSDESVEMWKLFDNKDIIEILDDSFNDFVFGNYKKNNSGKYINLKEKHYYNLKKYLIWETKINDSEDFELIEDINKTNPNNKKTSQDYFKLLYSLNYLFKKTYKRIFWEDIEKISEIDWLVYSMNNRINQSIMNQSNQLRTNSLGLLEMEASAAFLRKIDLNEIESEDFEILHDDLIYNPQSNKFNILKAFKTDNNALGYRIFLLKPEELLFVGSWKLSKEDNIDAELKSKLINHGIWFRTEQEFMSELDKGVIFNHQFILYDNFILKQKYLICDKSMIPIELPTQILTMNKIDNTNQELADVFVEIALDQRSQLPIRCSNVDNIKEDLIEKLISPDFDFKELELMVWEKWIEKLAPEVDKDNIIFNDTWDFDKDITKFPIVLLNHSEEFQNSIYRENGINTLKNDIKYLEPLSSYSQFKLPDNNNMFVKQYLTERMGFNDLKKYKIFESFYNKIIVIDERVQKHATGIDNDIFKFTNVCIPDEDSIKLDATNFHEKLVSAIENFIIENIESSKFTLIHYGILERMYQSNKSIIGAKLVEWAKINRVIVTSGRGKHSLNLPDGICYVNLSAVTNVFIENRSKYSINYLLNQTRK